MLFNLAIPYYRITIWTKKRKEPYKGIRLLEIWNPDAAYRVVENKAKNHFGESNIVKFEVVMLPKNSPDVKSLFKEK